MNPSQLVYRCSSGRKGPVVLLEWFWSDLEWIWSEEQENGLRMSDKVSQNRFQIITNVLDSILKSSDDRKGPVVLLEWFWSSFGVVLELFWSKNQENELHIKDKMLQNMFPNTPRDLNPTPILYRCSSDRNGSVVLLEWFWSGFGVVLE